MQHNQTNYQADGLDGYFLLTAQRCEQLLVVNFTDTNDQPRTSIEQALRDSQAREQQARAEAERQRSELWHVFEQASMAIASLPRGRGLPPAGKCNGSVCVYR